MEPKAYLMRYQEIQHQIEANAQEALCLRSLAEKCTVSFDTECSGTSGDGQRIPRITEQLLRLEAQTEQLTHTLDAVRAEIIAVINAVPQQHHRELLRYRYLAGMKFEHIAVKMHYSYQHTVHVLHPESLRAVKHLIESNIQPVI